MEMDNAKTIDEWEWCLIDSSEASNVDALAKK
jgi:hypothetical protein